MARVVKCYPLVLLPVLGVDMGLGLVLDWRVASGSANGARGRGLLLYYYSCTRPSLLEGEIRNYISLINVKKRVIYLMNTYVKPLITLSIAICTTLVRLKATKGRSFVAKVYLRYVNSTTYVNKA